VTVSTAPTPPVKVNRTAIDRVLANILDNAVRFATSAVTLAVGPGGDGALIVITDDGPGIPPGDRERVFERFGRLQDARDRDTGGSGLGLAIVRELIRQQGGTVTLGDAVSDSERRTGAERTADNEADADGEPGGPGLRVELRLPGARSPDTS
jgi:signal transduction histidine kinase